MALEALGLPETLVSRVEVGRLLRELEALDNQVRQHKHRHSDADLPLSALMAEVAKKNDLDLKKEAERERLTTFLQGLRDSAPVIHLSFAAEPPIVFTTKVITWLRKEVHPLTLLEVGLQPSIAAGCIIRTNSKYIDCSMRQHLTANRTKLLELIRSTQHA